MVCLIANTRISFLQESSFLKKTIAFHYKLHYKLRTLHLKTKTSFLKHTCTLFQRKLCIIIFCASCIKRHAFSLKKKNCIFHCLSSIVSTFYTGFLVK